VRKTFITCLVCAVLLLAALYNPFVNRWNTTPETYFYFIGALLSSLILLGLNIKNIKIELNIADISLISILGIFIIYELSSHPSTFYLKDEVISAISALCMYLCFKQTDKKYPDHLCYIIVALAIAETFMGLFQAITLYRYYEFTTGSIYGTFKNSGVFAIFLSCCLPCLISVVNKPVKYKILSWLCYFTMLAIVILVILVKSRTGLLLIAISYLVAYNHVVKKIWRRNIKGKPMVQALIFLLAIAGILMVIYLKYPSAMGRFFIWKICINMFLEKPFLGWGIEGFDKYYLYHQSEYFKTHLSDSQNYKYVAGDVTNAFCEYIMILIQFGILGAGAFLFFILYGYKKIRFNKSPKQNWHMLTFLLIMVSATFYYSFHVTMLLLLAMAVLAKLQNELPAFQINNLFVRLASVFLFVSANIGIVVYALLQYNATVIWQEANRNCIVNPQYSLKLFELAYPQLKHRSNFLYNYGAILYESDNYEESINVLEECRLIKPSIDGLLYLGKGYQMEGKTLKAESCFKDASYALPLSYNPKYFLVQLYLENGMPQKALPIAAELYNMPVKVASTDIDEIKLEMKSLLARYNKL